MRTHTDLEVQSQAPGQGEGHGQHREANESALPPPDGLHVQEKLAKEDGGDHLGPPVQGRVEAARANGEERPVHIELVRVEPAYLFVRKVCV